MHNLEELKVRLAEALRSRCVPPEAITDEVVDQVLADLVDLHGRTGRPVELADWQEATRRRAGNIRWTRMAAIDTRELNKVFDAILELLGR